MNEEYITNSSEETQKLGADFSQTLKGGDFLAFYGELGSGKTTFIQGLAKGLGITRRIISPTFIIVRHYKIKSGNFYHIDLYRTESESDLLGLGIDEMGELLPRKRIDLHFEYLGDNKRKINVKRYE
jgi:tRNA threonylcarbamoyladenosine biosynthesis protein TsaE